MSCIALPPRKRCPRCWKRREASGNKATRPRLTGRTRPWAPGRGGGGGLGRGLPLPGCSPTDGRAAGRRAEPGPPASSPATTPGASWLRGPGTERYGACVGWVCVCVWRNQYELLRGGEIPFGAL